RMRQPCAQNRRAHFDGRAIYDAASVAWLHRFLDLWIGHGQVDAAAQDRACGLSRAMSDF
ncbi:MAG TPA: hypothetical protein PLG99_01890, partial [Kaistiaceae bacterium]|nr:hypothetical protein [Kaistiaceae bacterium]